jgi:hypothetical protein
VPIQHIDRIFVPDRIGRLMKMQEHEQTRFQFEIWFEYTRQTMTELREGTLVAVKNFASDQNETHYSILEIVSIMPIHYALGESPEGYPGFVMEAARNIATDWTSQEDRSQEDTTIIRCTAMPIGVEIAESSGGRELSQDLALPMIGADIRILTSDATREVVNREISIEEEHVFEGGYWLIDSEVPIYIRAEDFVRVHFGIFGFTGVGKSNLVSTYISDLLRVSQESSRPVKIILFDLMGEYTVLLLDQLLTLQNSWILALGEYTFPGSVVNFLGGSGPERGNARDNAVDHLLDSTLYPKVLERIRVHFRPGFSQLLDETKIRFYQPSAPSFREFIDQNDKTLTGGSLGNSKSIMFSLRDTLRRQYGSEPLSPKTAQQVIAHIEQTRQQNEEKLTATAFGNLSEFKRLLENIQSQSQRALPSQATMSLDDIIGQINGENESSLFIVQSHDSDDLRDFAFELGRRLFERRRRKGIIYPLVSFVFDEADEFIPGQYERDSSYSRSAWIAETLARRGRKFGIGVGICTQRVRYLKTSVMAQPHTYLVSKMPRLSDREAIQEAFGFSEDMFRQTFKFAPGDWLLASHDATGLRAVPIPIRAKDANERIRSFLQNRLPQAVQEATVEAE